MFERRDALFERCDLRVEVLDHRATVIPWCIEKDASQWRRNEGVVFVWDDGHIGHHDGKRSTACRACRFVRIPGGASVRFDAGVTTEVATRRNHGVTELVQTYRTIQREGRRSHGWS